jgi:hypothetical protein
MTTKKSGLRLYLGIYQNALWGNTSGSILHHLLDTLVQHVAVNDLNDHTHMYIGRVVVVTSPDDGAVHVKSKARTSCIESDYQLLNACQLACFKDV